MIAGAGALSLKILYSQPVTVQWQSWLAKAFQETQLTNALVFTLYNGVTDARFLEHSSVYGCKLLTDSVRQKAVVEASSALASNTFTQDARVAVQGGLLSAWIAQQPESTHVVSLLMNRVCAKP